MRTPSIKLTSWLVVIGWVLVIGGFAEGLEVFYRGWGHSRWWYDGMLFILLRGPVVHIGLGSALWALARNRQ